MPSCPRREPPLSPFIISFTSIFFILTSCLLYLPFLRYPGPQKTFPGIVCMSADDTGNKIVTVDSAATLRVWGVSRGSGGEMRKRLLGLSHVEGLKEVKQLYIEAAKEGVYTYIYLFGDWEW